MSDKKISALTASTTPLAGTEVLPIVQSGVTKKVSVANLTDGRNVSVLNLSVGTSFANWNTFDKRAQIGAAIAANFNNTDNTLWGSNVYYGGSPAAFRYISTGTACLFRQDGGNQYFLNAVSGTANNTITFAEAFRIATTGNVTVNTGNLVIGTAGKGVDFSADPSAAGMTSELLDDYEEGTWTPTDASGAGLTLTVTAATYTKIGRMVYASLNITFPTTANGSTLILGGLPFTSSQLGSLAIGYTTQGASIMGLVGAGDTLFFLYDAAGNNLANSQMSAKVLRAVAIYPA
jgi:hypothetical protein